MSRLALDNPAYYINREASWLAFNGRVLEEAEDEKNPLLERLKFLSISASNLDEFFEVRVAGLVQQIEDGYTEAGPDGLTLVEERDVVSKETHKFVSGQYRCWNEDLRPHYRPTVFAFSVCTSWILRPALSSRNTASASSTFCLRR